MGITLLLIVRIVRTASTLCGQNTGLLALNLMVYILTAKLYKLEAGEERINKMANMINS
jgi:hypothetical protein